MDPLCYPCNTFSITEPDVSQQVYTEEQTSQHLQASSQRVILSYIHHDALAVAQFNNEAVRHLTSPSPFHESN